MKDFWKQSPEWQRKQELGADLDAAETAKVEAGRLLLSCIELGGDAPGSNLWRDRRQAYLDAVDTCDIAFAAWRAADEAFEACPAGRGRARFYSDPLVFRAAESGAVA